MGLGSLATVPLAEAREAARRARTLLQMGRDPIEHKRSAKAEAALEAAKAITFKEAAETYIEAHKSSWRNEVHAAQWSSTLERYAYPIIGRLPIGAIDVPLVLKVLNPIWTEKVETASRVRGRIEAVLAWATVQKHRTGDNPARWRGNLEHALPSPRGVRPVRNHPALPVDEVGGFMAQLREQKGIAALALEFAILTAARTSEVTGATWPEVNLAKALWTIPSDRIKAGKEHRVPLSPRAVEILEEVAKLQSVYLFPGGKKGKPLSENGMLALLKRMGRDDITTHGFRSTFRDWSAERTNYPNEVAEMALAHTIPSGAERAYRRGDLIEKRARMMADWAKFCSRPAEPAQVVPISSGLGTHRRRGVK
jgi:integrase